MRKTKNRNGETADHKNEQSVKETDHCGANEMD